MKSIHKIILAISILFGVSCNKDTSNNPEYPYEAIVLGINQDCGKYAIKFTGKIAQIKEIAGSTPGDSTYIASNLPGEFQIPGLQIKLNIRKADITDGLGPCTDYGPSYGWIHINQITKH